MVSPPRAAGEPARSSAMAAPAAAAVLRNALLPHGGSRTALAPSRRPGGYGASFRTAQRYRSEATYSTPLAATGVP